MVEYLISSENSRGFTFRIKWYENVNYKSGFFYEEMVKALPTGYGGKLSERKPIH